MLTEDQQERPLRSLEMEGADGSRTVPASATMSLDLNSKRMGGLEGLNGKDTMRLPETQHLCTHDVVLL